MSDKPNVSINWKESDVCLSITCICGEEEHFDGEFLRYYKCSACGKCYEAGRKIEFILLSKGQIADIQKQKTFFKTRTC